MTVSDRTNGYVLIDANKAWEKQFGITCEQVIGKNGSRIEFWCNPADREAVLRAVEAEGRFVATRHGCGEERTKRFSA